MRFPGVTWRLACGLGIASFASLLRFLRRKGKRFRLHKNRYCAAGVRVLRWLSIGGGTFPSPLPWPHAPQTKYCIQHTYGMVRVYTLSAKEATYLPPVYLYAYTLHTQKEFPTFLVWGRQAVPVPVA